MDLPLLTYTSKLYTKTDLSGCLVIGCQHLLGTTVNLLNELIKKGVNPNNIYIIGKAYSTNKKAVMKLKNMKVNVSKLSTRFNSHISFDEQFQEYIESFLNDLKSKVRFSSFRKIIVLDDGGTLLTCINDFFSSHEKVVGIEQTSSGITKLLKIKLHFPVISVARSSIKLKIESKFIARLVKEKIVKLIGKRKVKSKKCLVVGLGPLGKQIAASLKDIVKIKTAEVKRIKSHYGKNFLRFVNQFDIIVGVTGNTICNPGNFNSFKKKALLISASSSDREFNASYLRILKKRNSNPHMNYFVQDLCLVNSGFPINFDGKYHSLPPYEAQLTRSLLLAGVCEAVASTNKGLLPLSKLQYDIANVFRVLK